MDEQPLSPTRSLLPPDDPVISALIDRMQARFPAIFPKKPAPKVALKRRIEKDLFAHASALGATWEQLRQALALWCRGQRYWRCLMPGAPRFGLDGIPKGRVSVTEAAHAREQMATAKAEHDRGRSGPMPDRPAQEDVSISSAANSR